MDNLPWLDKARRRLARHALPPAYIQRFMEELSDHFQDVMEESMGTEADACRRLGDAEQLAEAAAVTYRRRSFLGRHPFAALLVFGVSPIASLVVLIAVAVSAVYLASEAVDWLAGPGSDARWLASLSRFGTSVSTMAACLASLFTIVIPAIVASILYCRLAGRLGIGKKWMLLSCTILAVLAALPLCTARISAVPHDSWLRLGVWRPQHLSNFYYFFTWTFCRPQQLTQFLAPLAIACWFVRPRRAQGQPHLAT